ncbi:MAG: beta-galactosidase [Deltaproteobacteria bacterium]|nr:beta-galactosidase [Deltaproteobacteria bacterium]
MKRASAATTVARVSKRTARSSKAPPKTRPPAAPRVQLDRAGLSLSLPDGGRELLPLRAGACHYWRLERSAWRAALSSLVTMELRLVETYVPWQVHEHGGEHGEPARYSFEGALDVAAFLREAHDLGLKAIVRPGPHINAELTDFGLPERIVWNPDCQARTPRLNPVMLPAPPRAFPVPSYASKTFLAETARWFSVVGRELAGLVWPNGPIVLVQIDNEGALYFRDGIYDQDYHPDAIAHYRSFLRARYRTVAELRRAYGIAAERFEEISPPLRYDVRSAEDLPRHLDWAESHEALLAESFATMADALAEAGFSGVPTFHNFPMGESATPLHAALVRRGGRERGLDLISLDYYHPAGDHRAIARRTTELAVACDALNHPAFAAEMGAGAPPFFPPLEERDAIFTLLCAMAYGVRGYNIYMAVERDRWLGSPVDRDGVLRPFAAFFRKLGAACDRVGFGSLVRDVPARLVVPRSVRRLARVMHAFGPVSQALFRVMGGGMQETVLEDDIDFGEGHGDAPPTRAGRILSAAQRALEQEGVPWALVDGGDADVALAGARLVIVPTSCGLDAPLLDALRAAAAAGTRLIFAPSPPRRDGSFRALPSKALRSSLDELRSEVLVGDEAVDVGAIRHRLRERALLEHDGRGGSDGELPRETVSPEPCAVTVHRDATGTPRVVFLINPTRARQHLEVHVSGVSKIRDLLDGTTHDLAHGVNVEASSVRFCEVVAPE